jgi:hypothetical protein
MSNFNRYGFHQTKEDSEGKSCIKMKNLNSFIGASSIFQKIKSNLSNFIFLNKEDGIDTKSKKIFENSFQKNLGGMQFNEINQVYDAPTLELNISNELDNPTQIINHSNQEYLNKNTNDTQMRRFSLDSLKTTQTKKKSNPITRIVQYITEKKFDTGDKFDFKNSNFVRKHSAFRPLDNKNKIIDFNSRKIINYNDFFEVMKDKNIIKPVPIKKGSSSYSQIAKKRSRPLDSSSIFREEERIQENGNKRRKNLSVEEKSLFSSVQNLNKFRNSQRDDVSMKSLNSVMSNKFLKEDKEKNKLGKYVNDDVSMNLIVPEHKSLVRSYYSKTLDEIKSEIEEKRGKNLRMLDEISRKSRESRREAKFEYEEKKRFLSNYYKQKEQNVGEMDLLTKGGKISLDESDLIRDKNLSYSKSSITIESAGKKNKNVDIVKISNFDICSYISGKEKEKKETPKEIFGFKTNENINQNVLIGQNNKINLGDSNALTDKKIVLGEKAESKDKPSFLSVGENKPNIFSTTPTVSTKVNVEPDISKSLFGFGEVKKNNFSEEKIKTIENVVSPIENKSNLEIEKKEDKKPSFGFGIPLGKEEAKTPLFGNIDKKEDLTKDTSSLFGEKKEDKGGLFGSLIKIEGNLGTIFEKKEENNLENEKKEDKLGFFANAEKKEEKPGYKFGVPLEKKEEKSIFSAFGEKPEEQKTGSIAQTPDFSLLNQEVTKKTDQEQKQGSSFSALATKPVLDVKIEEKGKDHTNLAEKSQHSLFPNKDSQPASNFNFPTTITTKGPSLNANTIATPGLFGSLKDKKEEKTSTSFGDTIENTKSSLFNLDNKSPTNANLFGTVNTPLNNSLSSGNQSTNDAPPSLNKKEPTSTSLVNGSNPFLQTFKGDSRTPTIFQSPNNTGINNSNYSIFLLGDSLTNNQPITPMFNQGSFTNKFSSSINNSNKNTDAFESMPGNKTMSTAGNQGNSQSLFNPLNPFFPKSNNVQKNDIFHKSGDQNDMAISPITSPKLIPKKEENRSNAFPNIPFGGNTVGTNGTSMFNTNYNSLPILSNTSNVLGGNAFINPPTNNIFSNPNSNSGGLFSQNASNMNMNQTQGTLFGQISSGTNPGFCMGKKK